MGTINAGSNAIARVSNTYAGYTIFEDCHLCSGAGVITSVSFYFTGNGTGLKAATFYSSGSYFSTRDYETLGNVTGGQTSTFTGLSIEAASGDRIGAFVNTDNINYTYPGTAGGEWHQGGDLIPCVNQGFGYNITWVDFSIYATGVTLPDAPTNVAATENNSTKVVVTWTKSADASGYRVYRDGVDISGLLEDVATFDDTTAAAPVITAGAAVASDGTSSAHVALSLSGSSIANGTSYNYTVKAVNAAGLSAASSANAGYRLASSLTYQWQRSAADSDASFSNISGATTASYNDTGAPADGSGRYFKCVLDATGSTQATSTANRGYRKSFIPRIIFM